MGKGIGEGEGGGEEDPLSLFSVKHTTSCKQFVHRWITRSCRSSKQLSSIFQSRKKFNDTLICQLSHSGAAGQRSSSGGVRSLLSLSRILLKPFSAVLFRLNWSYKPPGGYSACRPLLTSSRSFILVSTYSAFPVFPGKQSLWVIFFFTICWRISANTKWRDWGEPKVRVIDLEFTCTI